VGTDRMEEFRGPCACGEGSYEIDFCSVDHGWPTATPFWYESRIDCKNCGKTYEIAHRGSKFMLVEKAAVAEREARGDEARKFAQAICNRKEVQDATATVEKMLASQRSVAAKWRLLEKARLSDCSEGTFRRNWRGDGDCAKGLVSVRSVEKLLILVGSDPSVLKADLSQLDKLQVSAREPVPAVGEPFHTISKML
jgi:hypothetical protein